MGKSYRDKRNRKFDGDQQYNNKKSNFKGKDGNKSRKFNPNEYLKRDIPEDFSE